jgi:sterol desaturase/sphingolipid hydroxylase (fatty acid hydroxylase superfamily)
VAMNWNKLKYFRPFYCYPPLALLMLRYALRHSNFRPLIIVLLVILGMVEWVFLEYFLHRYPLHIKRCPPWLRSIISGRHRLHHVHSNELKYMFVPVGSGLLLSGLSIVARMLLFWPWQAALIVTAGVWAGYLFYEFIHYSAHLRRSRNPILHYLKIYHMKHHHQSENFWFGVTSPFLDILFGTYRPIRSARRV